MGRRRASEAIDDAAKRRMVRLYKQGRTVAELARQFGLSEGAVHIVCKESRDVESVESKALPVRRED